MEALRSYQEYLSERVYKGIKPLRFMRSFVIINSWGIQVEIDEKITNIND